MTWRQFTLRCPSPESVRLLLDGKVTTFEAAPDRVFEHYRRRPPDPFLAKKIDSALCDRNARRGMAMKQGHVQFDNFAATLFPLEPTWAENPFGDNNWQWSLHSLTIIRYLLAAHRKTAEDWFLSRAEQLILDWMCDNYTSEPPSRFSWSDHATALRLENLLYLLEYARGRGINSAGLGALLGIISTHGAVLADGAFYNKHTNHGLDQSYILYLAGAAFPEFVEAHHWRETGRTRLVDELSFAFTSEGLHVENSPSYHFVLLRRALQVDATLKHYQGEGLGPGLRDLLDKAFRFGACIMKPDGTLPILGDSEAERVKDDPGFLAACGLRGYEEFRYSVSQGREGVAPAESVYVFPKSGYAVLRSTWEPSRLGQSLYLLFKAGFLSAYHKHDDDLSFLLYNMGEDWIIDSGLYKYQEKDALRQYVRGPWAHNAIVVDNLSAARAWADVGKSHIDEVSFDGETGLATVVGSHTLYPGIRVCRRLSYARPDRIKLADHVVAADGKEHIYRALFHIPSDKTISVFERGAAITSNRTGAVLRIVATEGAIRRARVLEAEEPPDYCGWTSPKYGQRERCACLCLEGTGVEWRTVIELAWETA